MLKLPEAAREKIWRSQTRPPKDDHGFFSVEGSSKIAPRQRRVLQGYDDEAPGNCAESEIAVANCTEGRHEGHFSKGVN
jgi:hypothetical protein